MITFLLLLFVLAAFRNDTGIRRYKISHYSLPTNIMSHLTFDLNFRYASQTGLKMI